MKRLMLSGVCAMVAAAAMFVLSFALPVMHGWAEPERRTIYEEVPIDPYMEAYNYDPDFDVGYFHQADDYWITGFAPGVKRIMLHRFEEFMSWDWRITGFWAYNNYNDRDDDYLDFNHIEYIDTTNMRKTIIISGKTFVNSSIQELIGDFTIKAEAFIHCSDLEKITLMEGNGIIEPNAFVDCPKLSVHAPSGGTVEEYCLENGIMFVSTWFESGPTVTEEPIDTEDLLLWMYH